MATYAGDWNSRQSDSQGYAYNDFTQMFGRAPTDSELAQATQAYQSADPNRPNRSQGQAFIGQMHDALQNTPANLYAQQQQQWGQAAPQHYDAVNQMFQSTLGRAPNQDELSHYGTLLASGQADPYQLSQFLQSLPEYQNTQDTKFRQGLSSDLEKSDQNFFNRVSPQISQQYAMQGRPTSPALSVAMTDLAAQLSQNRGQYMAQLSAQQYGGNKAAALGNYGQTQNDVMGRINTNPNAQYQNIQGLNSRAQNIGDYATQAQNWGQMMNQYGPKTSPLSYLNTAFQGANAGANVYNAYKGG